MNEQVKSWSCRKNRRSQQKTEKGEGAGKVGQFHQLKKKRADRGSTAKGCNVGVEFQQGKERKEVLRWRREQEIKGVKGE